MKILGIDPGFRTCGYAVVEYSGNKKIQYVDSGLLKGHEIDNPHSRMAYFFNEARRLMIEFSPDHIALESLIFVKSPTALIKLAQARGAMIAGFAQDKADNIYEYSPNEVKLFSSGHGHSGKGNVQYIVGKLTGKKEFLAHDESDALAVVLCHVLHNRNWGAKIPTSLGRINKKSKNLKDSLSHLI